MKLRALTILLALSLLPFLLWSQSVVQPGEYREGTMEYYTLLGNNLKFTSEAQKLKSSGIAYAAIEVNDQGNVVNAYMVQEFDSSTSANILETLKQLKGFKPASYMFRAVPITYLFSVVYSIQPASETDLEPDEKVFAPVKEKAEHTFMLEPMRLNATNSIPQFRVKPGSKK